MESKNNRISALQYAIIGVLIGNSLFVGLGNMIIIAISEQDSWITSLSSFIPGIIPILLLIYLINYKPNLNIFDKNKDIFGTFLGNIINFLITAIFLIIVIINLWSLTNYANTKYLSETPLLFIAIIFMIPAVYACYKGIETIGRTSEILALFAIIIYFFVTLSLSTYSDFNNVKPILSHGINTIIEGSLKFISYNILPFFVLLVIPKNDIADNKKTGKYFIIGYIVSILSMVIVHYSIISVLGVDLVSLYRYPEYYVMKKLELFGVIQNVENFFAVHWLFNLFIFNVMAIYFIKEYINNIVHLKKEKTKSMINWIIAIVIIIGSLSIFPNSTRAIDFMKNTYPLMMALPLFIIVVLTSLIVSIKTRIKKKA